MRKKITKTLQFFFFLMAFASATNLFAAPIHNAPAVRIQPNGDTLFCLLSGDEYYHRLHDANGYTIVRNPQTGYWVYADTVHTGRDSWNIVATSLIAGIDNPATAGISPNLGIDKTEWLERGHRFDIPKQYQPKSSAKTSGRNHGTLNNIVIFVRFSDDTEIATPLSTINAMFNDSTAGATSMYNYFKTVSYNKIHIPTQYYPTPNGNSVVSYQDSLPRSYYMPYDATTNTQGYNGDSERASREFGLLQRAVNYVNANYPVPTTVDLDMDNDGLVDNICFVVKGTYTGWSDLLWPHKWALYDRYVYINGKRVYTFNLQLEGSGEHYFSSSTFCHEMFHTLGAPDLYRYEVNNNVTGVGSWDLMCSNTTPPQTMGAYMKWKYGNWIDSIPEITIPGTYSLHSLGDSDYSNIAYKIASPHPNQWYLLEYRDNTEQFETTLPGKGLLIYRIDDRFNGNANFDGISTFDEVYLFRPGGNNDTTNGYPAQAFFSGNTNRTEFSQSTDPFPWLNHNSADNTISITAIGIPGETISFTYNDLRGCMTPENLRTDSIGANAVKVRWSGRSANYRVQYQSEQFGSPVLTVDVASSSCTLTGLDINTTYLWRVKSVCNNGDESDYSPWEYFNTSTCAELENVTVGTAGSVDYSVPFNTHSRYSYSQTIYLASQIGQAMNIDRIAFNYADNNALNYKDNVIVYMALTDLNEFTGTTSSSMVPFSQLQQVYEGPINCTEGWNELQLNSTFVYDGFSNIVIAIDDNSGYTSMQGGNFYCSQTSGRNSTLVCSKDNDIDPSGPISAFKALKQFAADVRFSGCSLNNVAAIQVITDGNGTVTGGGLLPIGQTCTLTATADDHWHFTHWSDGAGQTITDNPYTFTVDSSRTLTAHFAKDQHTVSVTTQGDCGNAWFQVWDNSGVLLDTPLWDGTFDHGTQLTLFAEDSATCPNNSIATFLHWDDGNTENPRTVTLTQDCTFTAVYTNGNAGLEMADVIAIYVQNETAVITGADGRHIELLDITGRTVARTIGTGNDTFRLPAKGVYIIRIQGLGTQKIVN